MTKEKEAVTVEMSDKRVVEFVGKRKMLKEAVQDDAGNPGVRLDFRNGETRTFMCPTELLAQAAAHGLAQKLGDECSGIEDPDDMVLAVDELIDRLVGGEWNAKRESGGMAGASVLLKALVEQTGKPVEAVKAWLKGKSHAEKTALRNSPKLKPIIERLEAEKASKTSNVDTSALLGELDGIGA